MVNLAAVIRGGLRKTQIPFTTDKIMRNTFAIFIPLIEDWAAFDQARKSGTTSKYYRIQPKGLGIDHTSETSNGSSDRLHVCQSPAELFGLEGHPSEYGGEHPEVVEIASPGHRENGDVEGVEIDPKKSRILRRWSPDEFAQAVHPGLSAANTDEYDLTRKESEHPKWSIAKNLHDYWDVSPEEDARRHVAVA